MEDEKTYTWGELYDTLKEFNEPIEDELFQRFFKLVENLESEDNIHNFVRTIKSITFTETEINRINSLCLDGLFDFAKAIDNREFPDFLKTTAYKDTVNFIISKRFEFFNHYRYVLFLCRNPHKIKFGMTALLKNIQDDIKSVNRCYLDIFSEICENKVHSSVIEQFLDFFPKIIEKFPRLFVTACIDSDLDTVECLVKNGADIHYEYESALYHATIKGRKDIVKFLLENGAKIIPDREVCFVDICGTVRKEKPDPEALLR